MIGLGAALVHQAEWVLTIFAAFLIYAGIKMAPGRAPAASASAPACRSRDAAGG
jgi:predicted tellurium resistance membrane protein TerC